MSTSIKDYIDIVDLTDTNAYGQLIEIFTKKYPLPVLTVPIKPTTVIYRSRQNLSDQNFTHFDDLSYPPKELIKDFSRANKPHEQKFYASDRYETNLTELLPFWISIIEEGKLLSVTTSFWELQKEMFVGIIPDLKNQNLMHFINTSGFSDNFKKDIEEWNTINRYFYAQGFYDKQIYIVSSAFSNSVILGIESLGDEAHGILYTSVQNRDGWNLAVNPNFVDNHIKLVKVVKHFIRRGPDKNQKPTYNNFNVPEPRTPKKLDNDSKTIYW